MKRMLTLALGAVIAGSALPAFSQDNFPDIQENHWAYTALGRMRAAGLLVGYPDGMYRPGRPASRAEMAVALYALYQHLKGIADGLEAQQAALKSRLDAINTENFATKAEVQQLQQALATAQAAINGMKSWGEDIAALKRMASTFEKELASQGVDIEALKKGVSDLANRVDALEKRKMPVNISGDINLWMGAGYSTEDRFGITVDGRPTGFPRDGGSDPVGVTKDLTFGHEAAMTLTGNADTPYKWWGTFVVGNLTMDGDNAIFGNQSHIWDGIPFREPETDFFMQNLVFSMDTSLLGMDFNAQVGRVSHKVHPYMMQRPDNTPYFHNSRWDNGEWYFDGGIFKFKFGNSAFTLFGGRQSDRFTSDGVELNNMMAGSAGHMFSPDTIGLTERPRGFGSHLGIEVDQHMGATLNVPLGEKGGLNLAYLVFDQNTATTIGASAMVNRAIVFGGDLNYMFSERLGFNAGYSQSNLNLDSTTVVDEDNSAFWARLNYKADRWGLGVGYRSIDPQFYAPGYWGRIGIWWNPTDIQGFMVNFNFDLTDRLGLHASGGFYEGRDIILGGVMGLSKDDELRHYKVGLNYKVNDSWDFMVGGEFVDWDLADRGIAFTGGKPRERWYNVGLMYHMGENAHWSFLWQTSDFDSKGVAGMTPFGGSATRATGGFITSQVGIKY